ncbi:hypothetical protein ACWCPF_31065 [Streptomyces sp. NPDC001858]
MTITLGTSNPRRHREHANDPSPSRAGSGSAGTTPRRSDVGEVSPFSFFRSYGMDNSRATRLGFAFADARSWLSAAVAETLGKRP